MERIEQELETLEGFERYLQGQDGSKVAGLARNNCHCPLAGYLSRLRPEGERIEVACDGIAIGDGRSRHTELTRLFVREIDDGAYCGQSVTFASARLALQRAKRAIERDRQGVAP